MKRLNPRPVAAVALIALGAIASFATEAEAFRPSARWVVDQAVKAKLGQGVRTLAVEAEVTRFDVEGEAGAPFLGGERTWVLAPHNLRRETDRPDGVDLVVVAKKRTRVEYAGNVKKEQRRRPDVYVDFVTLGGSISRRDGTDRVMKAMAAMKIDTDVVSYARFDGRVMYLIGSKSWETDKPQVWFDKDTLRLARVVEVKKGADGKPTRVDRRLMGYGSPEGGAWWPKNHEVWVGGELQKRAVTRGVEKNKSVPDGKFDVD